MTTYRELQLDAVGDKTRRAILARLKRGPLAVSDIARGFDMSRPAISQHLAVLKKAKLVVDTPDGNRRLYQLNPEGFDSLRAFFDEYWGQALVAFRRRIEQDTEDSDS